MSLTSTTHLAKTDIVGVSFLMADQDRHCLVRVDVPRDQLIALGSSTVYSPGADLSTFESHRAEAEQIASAKYDGRDYREYANGRVVALGRSDWRRLSTRNPRIGDMSATQAPQAVAAILALGSALRASRFGRNASD